MPVYLTLGLNISPSAACRCEVKTSEAFYWSSSPGHPLHPLHCHHTCMHMRRGEKPEGHKQMRPRTFPASNYSGNSQQMLQEIRNSLRNLSKPSDPPKVDVGGQGKMLPEDSRQQGRSSNPKHPYDQALLEIRKSLVPFEVSGSSNNESNTSASDVNKPMLLEPPCGLFEEVIGVFLFLFLLFCYEG